MHIHVHQGSKGRKAAVLTVSDLIMDTGDWLLVGHPALLDMCSLLMGLRIEALHGEHQHKLMALLVLSLGIVCRQYAATELAELEFLGVFWHSSLESVQKVCSKQQSEGRMLAVAVDGRGERAKSLRSRHSGGGGVGERR